MSTPTHQPKMAGSPKWIWLQSKGPWAGRLKRTAKTAPLMIETMLKMVLALAGMPKICRALSMPITAAASETKRMNGKSNRVICTVRSNLPGQFSKPPLMR